MNKFWLTLFWGWKNTYPGSEKKSYKNIIKKKPQYFEIVPAYQSAHLEPFRTSPFYEWNVLMIFYQLPFLFWTLLWSFPVALVSKNKTRLLNSLGLFSTKKSESFAKISYIVLFKGCLGWVPFHVGRREMDRIEVPEIYGKGYVYLFREGTRKYYLVQKQGNQWSWKKTERLFERGLVEARRDRLCCD